MITKYPSTILSELHEENDKLGYVIVPEKSIKISTELIVADENLNYTDKLTVGTPYILVIVKLMSVRGREVSCRYVYFEKIEEANKFIEEFDGMNV